MYKVKIIDQHNNSFEIVNVSLSTMSVMNILKELNLVLGACDGMCLCGTCTIEVLEGYHLLNRPSDEELSLLAEIPESKSNSRLSCQIRTERLISDLTIKI